MGFGGVYHWGWKGQFWSNCHKNADLYSLETSLWPKNFLYRLLARSKRKSCSKSDKILSPKNLKSQKNSTKKMVTTDCFFCMFQVMGNIFLYGTFCQKSTDKKSEKISKSQNADLSKKIFRFFLHFISFGTDQKYSKKFVI